MAAGNDGKLKEYEGPSGKLIVSLLTNRRAAGRVRVVTDVARAKWPSSSFAAPAERCGAARCAARVIMAGSRLYTYVHCRCNEHTAGGEHTLHNSFTVARARARRFVRVRYVCVK